MGIYENYVDDLINCRKCQDADIKYSTIKCGSVNIECQELFKKYNTEAAKHCENFRRIVIGEYKQITLDRALDFILAGNAEFKIVSGKTQKEYYYKFIKKKSINEGNYIYWVTGGEDEGLLDYLGTVYFNSNKKEFEFSRGINGSVSRNNKIVISIIYLLNKLYNGKFNTNIRIFHNGNCGVCGRQLTDVSSIIYGIDKDCRMKYKHNIFI